MAGQSGFALGAQDEKSLVHKGAVTLGALFVACAGCGVILWTSEIQLNAERQARLEWAAYRDANCHVDGRATQVSSAFGVDPRPDAKLTVYRCRDGQVFATTRAFESQLEFDRSGVAELDSSDFP